MKDVFSLFGELFEQKNFLAIFLFLIFISYVEDRGDFMYTASLDYKVKVLREISELSIDPNIQKNPVLKKIYSNYLNEFSQRKALPMNTTESLYILLFKFLSGALLGIGYMLWTLRNLRNKRDQQKILKGAFAISLLFGAIGIVLPFFHQKIWVSLLINFGILLLFQITILLYIGSGGKDEKQIKAQKTSTTTNTNTNTNTNKKKSPSSRTRKLSLGNQNVSNPK